MAFFNAMTAATLISICSTRSGVIATICPLMSSVRGRSRWVTAQARYSSTVKGRRSATFISINIAPTAADRHRWGASRPLAQGHVVGRVGRAVEGAGLVASAAHDAAHGVDALDGRRRRKDAAAAARRYFELEPGDVARGLAGRVGEHLAGDAAAVDVIPVRAGVVAADRLAVDEERRDRLAERPGELAVGAGLAVIDLRALGMQRRDHALARRRDRRGDLGGSLARKQSRGSKRQGKRRSINHGSFPFRLACLPLPLYPV